MENEEKVVQNYRADARVNEKQKCVVKCESAIAL